MGTCIKCKKVVSSIYMQDKLCKECMTPQELNAFEEKKEINQIHSQINTKIEEEHSKDFFLSIVVLIAMYIVLNLLIYGGQEAYHWNDVKHCELMEDELNNLKIEISQIEQFVKLRNKKLANINQLEQEINQGLSVDENQYQQMIDEYNSNSDKYAQNIEKYDLLLAKHNSMVVKYNKLAENAYSRWWLIPIPLPSRHTNF